VRAVSTPISATSSCVRSKQVLHRLAESFEAVFVLLPLGDVLLEPDVADDRSVVVTDRGDRHLIPEHRPVFPVVPEFDRDGVVRLDRPPDRVDRFGAGPLALEEPAVPAADLRLRVARQFQKLPVDVADRAVLLLGTGNRDTDRRLVHGTFDPREFLFAVPPVGDIPDCTDQLTAVSQREHVVFGERTAVGTEPSRRSGPVPGFLDRRDDILVYVRDVRLLIQDLPVFTNHLVRIVSVEVCVRGRV